MERLQAVRTLFPSGDGQEQADLAAAQAALSGLPELDSDDLDDLGDEIFFAYDDFRKNPDEWMEDQEDDEAYSYWLALAQGDEAGDEEEDEDEDDDNSAPPGTGTTTPPGGSASTSWQERERGLKFRERESKLRIADDNNTRRQEDHALKAKERQARLEREAANEQRKQQEHDLRAEERRAKLAREIATERRRQEEHDMKRERHRAQLADNQPPPSAPVVHRIAREWLWVIVHPDYLGVAAELLQARQDQLNAPNLVARILPTQALAQIRARIDVKVRCPANRQESAIYRLLRDLHKAIIDGDDVSEPKYFEGRFFTGEWTDD